jgi:hypothetical protein
VRLHEPGGGDAENADGPGGVLNHGQDVGLGAAGQAGREKSHAKIASARERGSCDHVDPDRRCAGSIPAFSGIFHTAGGACFTPGLASSPWMRRYPHSGFSRASRRTG